MPTKNKDINCSKCGKKLAEGDFEIIEGYISIKCKCGIVNTLSSKPRQPYQERMGLNTKETFTIKHL